MSFKRCRSDIMKWKMKFFTFLSVIAAVSVISITLAAGNEIKVSYNNEVLKFDQQPVMENNKVLVPIRTILEKMNLS